jgi:hypothetical protein
MKIESTTTIDVCYEEFRVFFDAHTMQQLLSLISKGLNEMLPENPPIQIEWVKPEANNVTNPDSFLRQVKITVVKNI